MRRVKLDKGTTAFHDEDSNMPVGIANQYNDWNREVGISPHPDMVKHYPDLAHREYGVGHKFPKSGKNLQDAQDQIKYHVHNNIDSDFSNKVDVKDERDKTNKLGWRHFIDKSTNERMGSVETKKEENGNEVHHLRVNQDYRKKHNIDDVSLNSKTNLPKEGMKRVHKYDFYFAKQHEAFEKMLELKGKKSTLVGQSENGTGGKIYHINGTHEEGSASHEKHLASKGYTIDRHSPTAFTASKEDNYNTNMIHSTIHDGKLRSNETTYSKSSYSHKPFSELIESIDGGILTLVEDTAHLEKPSKYSYINEIAKLIK